MFVISVKSKKLKSYSLIALVAVFVTLGALYYVSLENNIPVSNIGGFVMKAETAEERKADKSLEELFFEITEGGDNR